MPSGTTRKSSLEQPSLWRGAIAIMVFAVIAVAARGVRWDETWEHAQILTGQVAYPEGHPLALYVHNAFSLQTYVSAGMLSMGAGPAVLCGLRNILFLLASILPVYVLTATMTRSLQAGLLASLLIMQGILLEFDGSYPTMVWPETYSNGHIGGGVVLLALAALIAGRFRTVFFLVGLIPCIHVGQWPPLAATAGIYGLYVLNANRIRAGARAARWFGMFGLGLAFTLIFWAIHYQFTLPLPEWGPFAAGGDTETVWKGYTAFHDPHRRFPPGNGHVVLAGTILIAWMGARWSGDGLLRRTCLGLAIYSSVVGALVWGTMAVHASLGPDIPFLLIAWMPYRLINHVPAIALALFVSLIVARWPGRAWWILIVAVVFGVCQPLWNLILGAPFHARYLAGGECVAFALYGVALFAVVPLRGAGRWRRIALAAAPILPLAMYHHFGAACVVAGVAAGYVVERARIRWPEARRRVRAAAIAVAACALIAHQYHHRQHLPVSPFLMSVKEKFPVDAHVVFVAPPDNLLLQATTGFPVLAEVATPSLISYVPSVGPAIDALYLDIYRISFRDSSTGAPWEMVWRERGAADWKELADRYRFTHVIAPADLQLRLHEILAGEDYALYAVDP